MTSLQWNNCPQPAKDQIGRLLEGLRAQLGGNLAGLYLHGSLAMGCFQPKRSDIDLLALVGSTIPPETKRALIALLLGLSGSPHPLEISFLRPEDLRPWRHPAPFDLHFSEDWRPRYAADPAPGGRAPWEDGDRTDPDLAAHITVLRARGIRLRGKPIADTFPTIPRRDYLAALVADLEWAKNRTAADPVYGVLNACRVLAWLRYGGVYSKTEGVERAVDLFPAEFHPLIRRSLAAYQSGDPGLAMADPEGAGRLLDHVLGLAEVPLDPASAGGREAG